MSITLIGDNFKYTVPIQKQYSDYTPIVKCEGYIDLISEKTDTVVIKHNSLEEFVTGMFLIDTLLEISEGPLNLVLPYIPGARQDRINRTGDVLNTLKSVSRLLNERYFENILVLDPHSKVAYKYIDVLVEYPLELVAKRINKKYDGIISPDKGAIGRAKIFDINNVGVVEGSKVRDVSDGKLSGFNIKVEQGKHYLIVDDICDGGGTFLGLNEKILEQGATADLYVSHGIFSKGTAELKKQFGKIYTTDSLHETPFDIDVINIVDDMVNFVRSNK
jgi:ribose-phosphate pyrophosphokinase